MMMFVLMIWLMILGIRLGFRALSFTGRVILELAGVFVTIALAGVVGVALLFFAVPVLLLLAV